MVNHARRYLAGLAITLAVLAGCARKPPPPPPAPVLPPAPGLRVTLTWNGPVDLDLYLTGPSWETVYFANNPARSGGKLERDVRCSDLATNPTEPLVEWTNFAEPSAGRYRIGVDYSETCEGAGDVIPFRVLVEYRGARREHVGVARHHQFTPIVLEFELRETGPGGKLTLESQAAMMHAAPDPSEAQP